jgi:hypothetical protein
MQRIRFIVLILLVTVTTMVAAQKVTTVTLNQFGVIDGINITMPDRALIKIDVKGNILQTGIEVFSERATGFSRIDPFAGRVENYNTTADKVFAGKVRFIGNTQITYYASFEEASLAGKIKSVGSLSINYYMPFDDASLAGKIKTLGFDNINYYSSFENEVLRGKIKSWGSTNFTFYSNFDNDGMKNKLKQLGNTSFTYYSSFDRQFAGMQKTGNRTNTINGILFLVN